MKILSGNEQRDSGVIFIDGQEIDIRTPRDARKYGIAIIHQELNTVPDMTVAENLFLGQEPTAFAGILDRKRMHREAREKLDRINADIDPQAPLGSLSIGRQQMVEIARAVSENAKVLVLDEPTAALSRAETLQLYRLIEQMRQDGVGMVYISHRMEEVWQLANRVTVFRDGTWIGTEILGNVSTTDIVRMMVGRQIVDLYQHEPRTPGKVLLEVRDRQAVRPARSPLRSTRAKWSACPVWWAPGEPKSLACSSAPTRAPREACALTAGRAIRQTPPPLSPTVSGW